MKGRPLAIEGAMLVPLQVAHDSRGAFTTLWESARVYPGASAFVPDSVHQGFNERAGTLRGLHFQNPPHEQSKLVVCTAGRLWDVIVDLRADSPTYLRYCGQPMDASSELGLWVPAGCAHGYVTLEDRTAVIYLVTGRYEASAAGVIRWDDPAFAVSWPVAQPTMSERDRKAPDFRP